MNMIYINNKIFKITFFLTLILIISLLIDRINKNNLKNKFINKIPKCDLLYETFLWKTKFIKIKLTTLNYQNIVGSTQGIELGNKKNLIFTTNGTNTNNVNIYDLNKKKRIHTKSLPINAANLLLVDEDKDNFKIMVSDYDDSKILILDKELKQIGEIKLPQNFKYLVGLAKIDNEIIIVPSRSKDIIGLIDLRNTNEIKLIKTNTKEENTIYDLEYSNGCFFLNYREEGKILLGYFNKKNKFKLKDININLEYPQGVWFYNNNLFVLETGKNSIIKYDFKKLTKTISSLPKGVYRGVTGYDDKNLIISGQILSDIKEVTFSTKIVTDENKSILHYLSY